MKNKLLKNYLIISLLIILFNPNLKAEEPFNFDVTELEITNNGNIIKGNKGGFANTLDEKLKITAESFEYNKLKNKLDAKGNVVIDDFEKNIKIFTDHIVYLKDEEIIYTKAKSKAIDEQNTIIGNAFNYNKNKNIINASGNVEIIDNFKKFKLNTEEITYMRDQNHIFTNGNTEGNLESKYYFKSKNVFLDQNNMYLSSENDSIIEDDNFTSYKASKFEYKINEKILKAKNLKIITNNNLENKKDKFYFSDAIFDFIKKKFVAKEPKILLHKSLLDGERVKLDDKTSNKKTAEDFKGQNDPRIEGVSSYGNDDITVINKGIFTSCKYNDNCPPWSIKAKKITHDKNKKNIYYDDAVLNIYDVPVFYFPKFFHPDPSVDRRSGFLQPRLNNSNIVGSSISLPYYHVISENKDLTLKPTIFDDRIYMFQSEYRQENKKSSLIADIGYTKGYKSKTSNNRNSMSHLFSKFDLDLDVGKFKESKIEFFIEKISMDTYLSIFEDTLITDEKIEKELKDHNTLTSGVNLILDNDDYNFNAGILSYENLQTNKTSDRYEYVFPYYDFSTTLFSSNRGTLSFTSNGNNSLKNTNNLKTVVSNNLNYTTNNFYSKEGFVNNFGVYFKNLNTIAKNDNKYRSNLQSEILNLYEFSSSLPLIKKTDKYFNFITPKISFRVNPSNMKDHSDTSNLITTKNVFSINRLGINDSFESGKSITLGLDYRKEKEFDINKYIEVKFAGILRDTPNYKIPKSSSSQGQTSNLFGSVENRFSENFKLDYNFSLDNNFKNFEQNEIIAEFGVNNFVSEFKFNETNGKIGDSNTFENQTTIDFDENNSLIFKTRRNRKISLTEYYDFIYEYKNDCLTAGIKYRKTYYKDRDLTPKEDLFLSITLFPLTSLDQKIDKNLYRDNNNEIIWK